EIARHLAVTRIGASDLIELRYTAPDPVLCQKTLETISAIFMSRFKAIKQQEAGSVVDYFIRETAASHERLQAAVERLRIFSTENRVINYYEQTKYIASQKELMSTERSSSSVSCATFPPMAPRAFTSNAASILSKARPRKRGMGCMILRRSSSESVERKA
ncbi:hypothetical protein IIA29_12440, partial [candidate division KSB1 bacterium]|nr:hypothetical protein [candidate division KSB1 bacterium]